MQHQNKCLLIVDEIAYIHMTGNLIRGMDISYLDPTENMINLAKNAVKIQYRVLLIEPFLFVMDYPEMRFKKVLESLVQDARQKSAPIVAFSTMNKEDLASLYGIFQEVHYDRHLQKPAQVKEIIKTVRELKPYNETTSLLKRQT